MHRTLVLIGCGAVLAGMSLVLPAVAAAGTGSVSIPGTHPSWATGRTPMAASADGSRLTVDVYLRLRDQAGADALAAAASNPADPEYGHYLSPAQVRARFAATGATVASVRTWLGSAGLTVGATAPNRAYIEASGTTDQIQQAFGVHLNTYSIDGRRLRAPDADVKVPRSIAGAVVAVLGLTESDAVPADTSAASPAVVAPPAGFRTAEPCASYYGQKIDTTDPPFDGQQLPYAVCGYTPDQLRSAYGLDAAERAGITGHGQTVAIVDAYGSPTLYSDAAEYATRNDPSNPLTSSQFSEQITPPTPGTEGPDQCGAAGWYGEQSLDVEAVHAIAPGADIRFVGAADCSDASLDVALNSVVANHLADVVTNSYADAGENKVAPADRQAFENIAEQAALEGITVTFASGDNGDEAAQTGIAQPNFPASDPWVTGVGGTSLGVGATGQRVVETGWETGISKLVDGAWQPATYDYGAGGGTSRVYAEPSYQQGVVPTALAQQNQTGTGLGRVVPDIAMDADPTTGMLIGITQTFPDGVYYDQYRVGGTSLASPLFAGVIALANQLDVYEHGFVNPLLYEYDSHTGAIDDVVHVGGGLVRVDYADSIDASAGYVYSVRTFDDSATQAIHTAPGYDDVTGLGTPNGMLFLETGLPPTETVTTPADNASYPFGSVPDAAFTCTAGAGGMLEAGLAGCSASIDGGPAVASGTALASALGAHTIVVTATDTDGQHTSTTRHYAVAAAATRLLGRPYPDANRLLLLIAKPPPVAATLTTADGAPLGGQPVAFSVGGTPVCTAVTGGDGTATCVPRATQAWAILRAGGYHAEFAGSPGYLPTGTDTEVLVCKPSGGPCQGSTGPLPGVAAVTGRAACVSWTGAGFAPGWPVQFLAYPANGGAPTDLASVGASDGGTATYAQCLPRSLYGNYTILATGYRADGTIATLTASTRISVL